mmetsp:Transcript_20388/g.29587  ORF Transcript_20388/g.29587 Transcript_20388/m.29587 type:complete len:90 (-) Transcript_20388:407-676(-)
MYISSETCQATLLANLESSPICGESRSRHIFYPLSGELQTKYPCETLLQSQLVTATQNVPSDFMFEFPLFPSQDVVLRGLLSVDGKLEA